MRDSEHLAELRRRANDNLVKLNAGVYDAPEPEDRPKKPPYVPLHQRPDVVELGRLYDEQLAAQVELDRCLKRLNYLSGLKYSTMKHAEEAEHLWGAAEHWQAVVDAFWERPDMRTEFHDSPVLRQARAAYKRSLKV